MKNVFSPTGVEKLGARLTFFTDVSAYILKFHVNQSINNILIKHLHMFGYCISFMNTCLRMNEFAF